MSVLKKLEKKLETVFEGAFSKGFKSIVQPVEIAKKMAAVMDEEKVVGIARTYAPNKFVVTLSPADKKHFATFEEGVTSELQNFLITSAKKGHLTLIGRPQITFVTQKTLRLGQFSISAELSGDLKQEISKEKKSQATIIMPKQEIKKEACNHLLSYKSEGLKHSVKIKKATTRIGRSKANDISIPDPGISRHHVNLVLEKDYLSAVDLGSTNGMFVNGKRVAKKLLNNGDSLDIGSTRLVYRRIND
ncbi:MAG: DUF2662 domain-containing protein [Actinobacteria bacterium]|nr:MAG: DUF2662 domain-containing protein [Actinomycetota bacterium]